MPTADFNRGGPDPAFLARVYQFERNRLTGIIRTGGDGYVLPAVWRPDRGVWRKLRSYAAGRGIDPVRYVRWCLAVGQVGLPPSVPEPNRLLEVGRMELYVAELPKTPGVVRAQFEWEKDIARRNLTVRQTVYGEKQEVAQIGVVAGGRHLNLSPLFCYVLARSIGTEKLKRIAGRWERDALFQFSCDPEENAAVYGADGHLPPGFAGKAAGLYASVVDGYAAGLRGGARA